MARDDWLRHRPDPLALWRGEIARLAKLGVRLVEVAPPEAARLFARFIDQFIDPEHAASVRALARVARPGDRPVELGRLLRADRTSRGGPQGCAAWLASRKGEATCVRFERRLALPVSQIALVTLEDAWAASWPGVFVNFEAGRAVVITPDYEDLRCDTRSLSATPYR
jgi:hypothetical protein